MCPEIARGLLDDDALYSLRCHSLAGVSILAHAGLHHFMWIEMFKGPSWIRLSILFPVGSWVRVKNMQTRQRTAPDHQGIQTRDFLAVLITAPACRPSPGAVLPKFQEYFWCSKLLTGNSTPLVIKTTLWVCAALQVWRGTDHPQRMRKYNINDGRRFWWGTTSTVEPLMPKRTTVILHFNPR